MNKDTADMMAKSVETTAISAPKDNDESTSRPGSPKVSKVRPVALKPTPIHSDFARCSSNKSTIGADKANEKSLHVLQPHSHKRHYEQHMLDHFSSHEFLRKKERFPRRAIWNDLAPVTTACEYKDTNFLSQSSDQHRPVSSHMRSSMTRSLGRFTQETRDGIFATGQFSTGASMQVLHKNNLGDIEKIKLKNVIEQKAEKQTGHSNAIYKIPENKVLRPSDVRKHDCSYVRSKSSKQFPKSLVIDMPKCGPLPSRRAISCPGKARGKNRRSIASLTEVHQRVFVKHVDAATQTFVSDDNKEIAGDACFVPTSTGYNFEITEEPESVSSASTPTSPSTSSATEFSIEPISETKDITASPQRLRLNQSSGVTTKQELKHRMSKNRIDLQFLRSYVLSLETNYPELKLPFLAVLNDLEVVSAEGYELYDNFDDFPNDDHVEIMRLNAELKTYKRAYKVLEYRLRRFEQRPENCDEEIGRLTDEVKLSRHVAVSLHYELQTAEKRMQKFQRENEDCRVKVIAAETKIEILEKEDRQLRNTVDQLSLHASSIPANQSNAEFDRNSTQELRIKLKFQEEELKSVLDRLVRTEIEMEKYKEHHGKCKVGKATSNHEPNEENIHSELKLRLNEDQATALGRKVIALELENESLGKQLRELLDRSSGSRKPSSSDLQFLEDEVEVLRNALQDLEDENFILKTRLADVKYQLSHKSDELEKQKSKVSRAENSASSPESETFSEHTISNRDFNTSSLNIAPRFMAIDEATQTSPAAPKFIPSPSPIKETISESRSLVQEISYILSHTENVEDVVSELRQLAVATRRLLTESPSRKHSPLQEFQSSLKFVVSETPIEDSDAEECVVNIVNIEKLPQPVTQEHSPQQKNTPKFLITDFIGISLLTSLLLSNLPVYTAIEVALLFVIFFIL